MQKPYNVIKQDIEHSCFTCDHPTRLYVMEFEKWLCLDCIMSLSAVEYVAKTYLDQLDRHLNN